MERLRLGNPDDSLGNGRCSVVYQNIFTTVLHEDIYITVIQNIELFIPYKLGLIEGRVGFFVAICTFGFEFEFPVLADQSVDVLINL